MKHISPQGRWTTGEAPSDFQQPAPAPRRFRRDRGIARCGLACCVCSENDACTGCRDDGCKGAGSCEIRRCAMDRNLPGCWACAAFPCGQAMLNRPRQRAFLRFAARHGADDLMDALERNERRGVRYHDPGTIVGDYDRLGSEEAVLALLEAGPEAE